MRARIFGTAARPRFSVFRSNRHLFLQLIDDRLGKTLLSASDAAIKVKKGASKKERAALLGKYIAEKAKEKGVDKAVFDRGGCKYHGLIKEVAEGARRGGLQF